MEVSKETYITQKAALLKEYKNYTLELEGAESNFEEEVILEKKDILAKEIKLLGEKIRAFETLV